MSHSQSDWKFKFPNYVSEASETRGELTYTATKKLSFVAYWGIRLIHGKKKLQEMSSRNYLWLELNR